MRELKCAGTGPRPQQRRRSAHATASMQDKESGRLSPIPLHTQTHNKTRTVCEDVVDDGALKGVAQPRAGGRRGGRGGGGAHRRARCRGARRHRLRRERGHLALPLLPACCCCCPGCCCRVRFLANRRGSYLRDQAALPAAIVGRGGTGRILLSSAHTHRTAAALQKTTPLLLMRLPSCTCSRPANSTGIILNNTACWTRRWRRGRQSMPVS